MHTNVNLAKYYWRASLVCGIAILYYVYEFTLRTIPSAITHELMRDFHISAVGLGVLSSMFYYCYVAMQIPAGLLLNRFSARLMMTGACGLCAVGALMFGFAENIYVANFAYLLIGFASSFGFIGPLVLISRWFPPKHFALLVGVTQLLGCVGAILGEHPIVQLTSHIGWQSTVFWFAGVGIILSLLCGVFVRDRPEIPLQTNFIAAPKEKISQWKSLKIVCGHSQTWFAGLYAFCIWMPVVVFGGLWGIPFLVAVFHTTTASAALGITIFWIGIAAGSPLLGWWSNYINRRSMPLTACSILAVVSGIIVIYAPNLSWPVMCIALFLFGVSAAGQALSFGVVQDNNVPSIVGTAVGFNNMAVILGGIFLQPLAGMILKYCWDGTMIDGVALYTASNYRVALACVPICGAIGLFTSLFLIKETNCLPTYDKQVDNARAEQRAVVLAH